MKWKNILFDLDGTLINTSEGIGKAINYTINQMMLPPITPDELRKFIGPPIYESFKFHYGLSEKMAAYATEIFRTVYKDKFLFCAKLYDGIVELLDNLRNSGNKICLSVATNKREDYTITLLKYFHLEQKFDIIVGSDFENAMKKKDIIQKCMVFSQIDPKKSLMIGDTIGDYIGAKENQIDFMGVSYGFGFSDEDVYINKQFRIAKDAFQLQKYILL